MYAAHKAAGGMPSIYRQVGIACERLFRAVVRDSLNLSEDQVAWGYDVETQPGKTRRLTLDARIDGAHLKDAKRKRNLTDWLARSAEAVHLPAARAKAIKGAVFEVRQGYKSADSKRQNADLAFGLKAYSENYLPVF